MFRNTFCYIIFQCSDGYGLTRGMRVRITRLRNAEWQTLFRREPVGEFAGTEYADLRGNPRKNP